MGKTLQPKSRIIPRFWDTGDNFATRQAEENVIENYEIWTISKKGSIVLQFMLPRSLRGLETEDLIVTKRDVVG